MPMSFFDDWDPCDECGFDHKWNREESVIKHSQIIIQKERERQMEIQNSNEGYELKDDPSAYMYAAATLVLILAFCASIYWAW